MVVVPQSGSIQTKQKLTDYQQHIEWRTPARVVGKGKGRGNSGVFMQGSSEELGRASCRERVCMYVSLSVVAVPLQPTLHKHRITDIRRPYDQYTRQYITALKIRA